MNHRSELRRHEASRAGYWGGSAAFWQVHADYWFNRGNPERGQACAERAAEAKRRAAR